MADRDIKAAVPGWSPPGRPAREAVEGRYVRLEPVDERHAGDLFGAFDADPAIWEFISVGPFATEAELRDRLRAQRESEDPLFFAVVPASSGRAEGVLSYLRIAPDAGSIELGWITFAPSLQRTPAATEAMVLMIVRAFEAGYRRFEWKCDAANLASRRAAERLGLSFEGIFRQAGVVKGRNRDTAWFAAIDGEWPRLRAAYDAWLSPENFDADGRQRRSLSALTRGILVARDPALS